MKHAVKGLITAFVIVAAISIGMTLFTGGVQWVTAPFRGAVDEREQTVASGDYRIANKNHFYSMCSSVQSKEDSIRNLENERENASEDRQGRIDTSLVALENSRAELIREYNADSANELREALRSDKLPESLDIDNYNTECVVE